MTAKIFLIPSLNNLNFRLIEEGNKLDQLTSQLTQLAALTKDSTRKSSGPECRLIMRQVIELKKEIDQAKQTIDKIEKSIKLYHL